MGLSGKLIGGGLGYFLGGPLGAVVGGIIGHYVKDAPLGNGDRQAGTHFDPRIRQQQQELHFVASLVGILTAMMNADGEVRRDEVRAIRTFFSDRLGYRGESLDIVRGLMKQFLRQGVDLDALCHDVARRSDYATRLLLVECLLDVARADGRVHPAEQAVLKRAMALLGIADSDPVGLRADESDNGFDYKVLGVSPSDGPEKVKHAYRGLVKQYHPDRVAHLGEEFRQLAHRKFLAVQEAYDRIRLAKGWG
jgi:DnaJ like chaperone protein